MLYNRLFPFSSSTAARVRSSFRIVFLLPYWQIKCSTSRTYVIFKQQTSCKEQKKFEKNIQ